MFFKAYFSFFLNASKKGLFRQNDKGVIMLSGIISVKTTQDSSCTDYVLPLRKQTFLVKSIVDILAVKLQ